MVNEGDPSVSVSVAVVGICGAEPVEHCLRALQAQEGAPKFEVVVAYDPHIPDMETLGERFPDVRFVANEGQRTPLELASRAIRESPGDTVLLTEDHCIPEPDWVVSMLGEVREGRAAVGGVMTVREGATATDWAFYFVDFFRYAPPIVDGPSPTLTVCNVAYRRAQLDEIADVWPSFFHETAVNDALRSRYGDLYLTAKGRVSMSRPVRLGPAIRERYAFGRLFGCTRLEFCSAGRRLYYTLFAPALPVLLLGRMAAKGLGSKGLRLRFLGALVPLTLMVLAWSWGEWLGYLTRKRPANLTVAPPR